MLTAMGGDLFSALGGSIDWPSVADAASQHRCPQLQPSTNDGRDILKS
jgi:hypothetical protein